MTDGASALFQQNLVSSRPEDGALLLDPAFINAWGLALRPAGAGGHWWVANTDTSRVTLYIGDSPTVPFGQDRLSVVGVPGAPGGPPIDIPIDPPTRDGVPLPPPDPTPAEQLPPSNPTGQVYSGSSTDFLVSGTSLTGDPIADAPARFITVSEDGTIAAWGETGSTPAERMNAFSVVVDNSANGAIYKGVAISDDEGSGNLLYAANFSQARIDVFDANWMPIETSGFEPQAPGGRDAGDFSPFNIERVFDASRDTDVLVVAYARVADAAAGEEEPTDGFIATYTLDGTFLAASDGGGLFNAPWGIALAPSEFGAYHDYLLVGNFGDGRIVALDMATLEPQGYLLDQNGQPAVIDGLWDLAFGNGESLGYADRLYFSAGPEEETHGLFGSFAVGAGDDDPSWFVGNRRDDIHSGGAGEDFLWGRGGDDTLLGQRGNDDLRGGPGRDILFGGADDDLIRGGAGRDSLAGGAGDDVLVGGPGADTMAGGAGDDIFRFRGVGTGWDTITDFTAGEDMIEVDVWRIDDIRDLWIRAAGNGDTQVFWHGGHVTLANVSPETLSESDFQFG